MSTAGEVFHLFEQRGSEMYFGEDVSILEHSLQTAMLAAEAGADRSLVVAALLHDVGHLLHDLGEDVAARGIDARHEIAGEAWLRSRFGAEVSEPVRLHVAAKRYLCAVDAGYFGELSASSRLSLELQGGVFSEAEVREFERNPYFRDAVRLRRWDDAAKDVEVLAPALETYRVAIKLVARG